MQLVELLMRVLRNLMEVSCVSPKQGENVLVDFERQHCFHAAVQKQLTADVLRLLCENMKCYRFYVVHVALNIRLILFQFEEWPVIFGPFVEKEWEEREATKELIGHRLTEKYLLRYKTYYNNYRCLNVAETIDTMMRVIMALKPEGLQYQRQVLFVKEESDIVIPMCKGAVDANVVEERYQCENLLVRMVRQGNTEGAFNALQSMSFKTDERYPVQTGNGAAGINIIRTLLRKAAEEGGAPLLVVDAISQEYARKAYAARSVEELKGLSQRMIEDYCAAVRKARKSSYLPPVRKAVDYIELNLSSIQDLKPVEKASGVSLGYLSHVFKREVGCTITQYIVTKRCERAADLLENTDYSIQDISNYVGYLDNNYFSRVFKAQYQVTPSQYRRQSRNPLEG